MNFTELEKNIIKWADDKNLLKEDNTAKQMMKVIEELGELSCALLKNDRKAIIDGYGDTIVTLIISMAQRGLHAEYCLEYAWQQIKNRTGKTENGTFIKDSQ